MDGPIYNRDWRGATSRAVLIKLTARRDVDMYSGSLSFYANVYVTFIACCPSSYTSASERQFASWLLDVDQNHNVIYVRTYAAWHISTGFRRHKLYNRGEFAGGDGFDYKCTFVRRIVYTECCYFLLH